jgi:hypothetical protein
MSEHVAGQLLPVHVASSPEHFLQRRGETHPSWTLPGPVPVSLLRHQLFTNFAATPPRERTQRAWERTQRVRTTKAHEQQATGSS